MNYEKQMSSAEPGLILIMVDQSYSMTDTYIKQPQPKNKAEFASMAVNRVINEIIIANTDGLNIKNRCFMAVIGYGQTVEVLQADELNEIVNKTLRTEKMKKSVSDGAGGIIEVDFEMPIWVDSKAANGTPMHEAFANARAVISEWIKNNPNNAAPIVVNISDGEPNDSKATELEAKQLMDLKTSDGNVLLFNAHISEKSLGQVIIPNSSSQLSEANAQFLFGISSEIPDSMYGAATASGFQPQSGSRGMVFNADAETLVRLLNFGSSGATGSANQR